MKNRLGRSIVLSLAWLVSSACLGATEIRLHIRTNAPCTDAMHWQGVAVYAGEPGSVEHKEAAFTTTTCDANGQVGSVVVVPSGTKDAEVGLRVVAGVTRNPEECAAHRYDGCIVARRTVRFNRHEALDLDFDLTSDCLNQGCDATHTCVDRVCTEARVSTPPEQGNVPEPRVRCGDNGATCPTTGNVCCLTIDPTGTSTFGECRADCPPTSVVLGCDDETDCSAFTDAAGHPGLCLLIYDNDASSLFIPTRVTSSQCGPFEAYAARGRIGLELCQQRVMCYRGTRACVASVGRPTNPNPLPGYFWCELSSVE